MAQKCFSNYLPCISLYLSLFLSLTLSLSISSPLSVLLSIYLSIYLSITLSHCLSLSFSPSLSLNPSLSESSRPNLVLVFYSTNDIRHNLDLGQGAFTLSLSQLHNTRSRDLASLTKFFASVRNKRFTRQRLTGQNPIILVIICTKASPLRCLSMHNLLGYELNFSLLCHYPAHLIGCNARNRSEEGISTSF